MVNAFRTTLANLPPLAAAAAAPPGEEYVPPGFAPRTYAGAVAGLRGVLFGPSPDRALVNWRCRQYLAAVAAAGLWDLVTAADPRVLHPADGDPDADLYRRAALGVTVTATAGAGTLLAAGDPGPQPRAWFHWRVAVNAAGNLEAREAVDGVPSGVTVAGTATAVGPVGTLVLSAGNPAGTTWEVDLLWPPPDPLAAVLATAEAYAGALPTVLAAAPARAVRAYQNSPQPLVRLGGLVAALVAAQGGL